MLSSKSIDKVGYIQKEVKTALEKLKYYPKGKSYLIPIRLNDCNPLDKEIKKLHWIDVFPETEYQNGLKKILQVVSPGIFLLRSEPMELSEIDVQEMIKRHNFFERYRNILSKGFFHKYKGFDIKGDKVVYDDFSCLMWQQGGSDRDMEYNEAKNWIIELNRKSFAGFNDWRLPTLEEAMSLVESERKNDLYIDSIFDRKQIWIWTADQVTGEQRAWAWMVYFTTGRCFSGNSDAHNYARAVRSGQSSQE